MAKAKPVPVGERNRRGGWRGSPNSIASLFRHQVPFSAQRKCTRCRDIALRGSDRCTRHAGPGIRRAAFNAPGHPEARTLQRMERAGLLPAELLALPVWRDLLGLHTATRAPMRLALVGAWDKRVSEPLHWAQVQRRAIALGKTPGRRRIGPAWRENQ